MPNHFSIETKIVFINLKGVNLYAFDIVGVGLFTLIWPRF